jgi:hypothetical protein
VSEPAAPAASTAPTTLQLRRAIAVVALLTLAWSCLALGARATYGARTTADEPQYLLSALSLWEDHSLIITDELAEQRYRPFHEVRLPVQTQALDDTDRQVSPHDPLLPAILAAPMGLGGWVAAKATLAVLAALMAGLLVWVAVRRLQVPVRAAGLVVATFALSAPLSAYATQVYPELPAALAVTVAVAALIGPLGRPGRWAAGLAVVALPWLGVKYAPVAGVLALLLLGTLVRRGDRRHALATAAALAAAGMAFLVAHRAWYGGWTVYAAGDHFVGGELSVVGSDPDHLGRTRRVLGLLLDRGFGLAAWAPAYLLVVPALVALGRRRPPGWLVLLAPLAAGWATATWVALTMHGWWWPGRQVVVVLPCVVLAVAWFVARAGRWAERAIAALGAGGVVLWGWLVVEVLDRQRTLIVDFEATRNPLYRAWRAVLPDYRVVTSSTWVLQSIWLLGFGALAWVGWRTAAGPPSSPLAPPGAPSSTPAAPINRRNPDRVPA